jgi:hypothetical protein
MLRAGRAGFNSRQGWDFSLCATASRTALGPAQPPIQWVTGALTSGAKRPGREAGHLPPSSAEGMRGATPPLPSTSWLGAYLNRGTTSRLPLTCYKFPYFFRARAPI